MTSTNMSDDNEHDQNEEDVSSAHRSLDFLSLAEDEISNDDQDRHPSSPTSDRSSSDPRASDDDEASLLEDGEIDDEGLIKDSKRKFEEIESIDDDSEGRDSNDGGDEDEDIDSSEGAMKRRRIERQNTGEGEDENDMDVDNDDDEMTSGVGSEKSISSRQSRSQSPSQDEDEEGSEEEIINDESDLDDDDSENNIEKEGENSIVNQHPEKDSNNGKSPCDEEEKLREQNIAKIKTKYHPTLIKELKAILNDAKGSSLTSTLHEQAVLLITEIQERYRRVTTWKPSKNILIRHPKTEKEFMKELRGDEEEKRPWMPKNRYPSGEYPIQGPLVRAWDERSKARINNSKIGLLSGGSGWQHEGPLYTYSGRKAAIRAHSRWRSKMQTPFISTTSDCKEVFDLWMPHFDERQRRSGIQPNTRLTLINPNVLFELGLPLLKMREELERYDVQNEFGGPTKFRCTFYDHEYLMLWNACPRVIVCTWTKDEIDQKMNAKDWTCEKWWQEELMVKFEAHEKSRREGGLKDCPEEGCSCCGHR